MILKYNLNRYGKKLTIKKRCIIHDNFDSVFNNYCKY